MVLLHRLLSTQYPPLAGELKGVVNAFSYFYFSLTMSIASNNNLWHYNTNLRDLASQNRKSLTKTEACLWKLALCKRQMKGYQFRRQRPVLSYIADFMCKELMLIIEVDGFTHQWAEVAEKDIKRQQDLEKVGFTVLHFSDDEVLEQINRVIGSIEDYIENRNC